MSNENPISYETTNTICVACHKNKDCISIRKGVIKCPDCICDQVGRSTMDLFRKGTRLISSPVNVLVALSGGVSSMFVWDLFQKRLAPSLHGKTAVVRKLEAITSKFETVQKLSNIPKLHSLEKFTISSVIEFAKQNDFNCVVLGDNVDRVSLANIATLSCGRPDLARYTSTDDFQNYMPIVLLRPARQCLRAELEFCCRQNNVSFDEETTSPFELAFTHEAKMIQNVIADGNGAIPFAIQKMGEKLPPYEQQGKCPSCGLPGPDNEICAFCHAIQECE
ncbi:hypothetical protein TRFO_24575 [Tritrichomonas foetus]|uniref:Cytoplasmic tRNA 2-thiolation protein 2 n=1 Tax=Tritrichomonas foetus TaxID=1144522 RepID=A0A1J4K8V3_9EUKA|nr:hypothetical protein TRFO_24575 [Tritrichomonas foetus]|eukprot:OHT07312.1 hypothetical protein TRFO_24575 [Tritrichomonas foetus]